MALSKKNWTLNSYTNDTWTDLVDEEAIISTIIVNNTSASSIVLQMRLEDSASGLADIQTNRSLTGEESYVLDVRSLAITGTQALQIQADASGLEFLVSGVV